MKTKIFNIALASVLFVLTSVANAGIITLNDSIEVGVLSIDQSFTEFYNYQNASANIGLEREAAAVMFIAEYNGDLALFTLLDAAGPSHGTRSADLSISGFDAANVILSDDSNESNANGFSWAWADCCTDGMIYKIDDADNFDLELTFSNVVGISDFIFLSFGSLESPEKIVSSAFSIQSGSGTTPVPEPSTLVIFALSLLGLASRRIKKDI